MNQAFTLLELSVVLVIIGLIASGVLVGQNLIANAELRAVTAEYESFVTAINAFRTQYKAIPGDMRNATRFWGAQHATHATCIVTPSNSQATCNGDGNGQVGAGSNVGDANSERFRAWQQLASAGLISGTFTGVAGSAGSIQAIPGTNAPESRKTGAGWSFQFNDLLTNDGDPNRFIRTGGHYFWFGAPSSANRETMEVILTTQDAFSIDSKIDDGRPGLGNVQGRKNATTCYLNNASAYTATYNLQNSAVACTMFMKAF